MMNTTKKNKQARCSLAFSLTLALSILLVLPSCLPVLTERYPDDKQPAGEQKILRFENYVYEPNIHTIQLLSSNTNVLQASAVSLQQTTPVVLRFDVLGNDREEFRAKVIHCNRDWKPSSLNVIEYLNDFNEFYIQDYQSSFNTRVPYIHYQWQLPKVKVSGNYLLKIYRGSDEQDLLLTYRLVVFENLVSLKPKVVASDFLEERDQSQQIEFQLDYQGFQILNPQQEIKAVLRQNYRWDNAIRDLPPLNVRELNKKIEYRAFDGQNTFLGGNEFRRFQIKSTRFLGLGVSSIRSTDTNNVARLELDESRASRPYVKRPDFNGFYQIERYESQSQSEIEADYVQVTFRLKSDFLGATQKVYVLGAFNLWTFSTQNEMKYLQDIGEYQAEIPLKQGEYNYLLATLDTAQKASLSTFEGNFRETENLYDILIYYQPPGQRYEQVIGYHSFSSMP